MNSLPIFLFSMPGGGEWIIILLVVVLLFGGAKIPQLMKGLGEGIREFKKAKDGEFDMINSKKEYETLLEKLYKSTKDNMKISQVEFQELVGRIEVLGELIIRKEIE